MATGTTAQQIIDVVTPAAGESVSEGTILEWHVKVGDFIRATDTIVEISTDKVDLELPSPASGTVTEILIEEGETVTVGQVIARIAAGHAPAGDGAAREAPAPAAESPPRAAAARARRGRRAVLRQAVQDRLQSERRPRAQAVTGARSWRRLSELRQRLGERPRMRRRSRSSRTRS